MIFYLDNQVESDHFFIMKSSRWGMAIGIYTVSAIGVWYLWRLDWNNEAKKTLERLSSTVSQLTTDSSVPLLKDCLPEVI